MKDFPRFTKSQIELLRVALCRFNFQLQDVPNLLKTTVEIDYCFDGMFGFTNPIDNRKLAYCGESYVEALTMPVDLILQAMHQHEELLS